MYQAEDTHWWYRGLHNLVLNLVSREFRKKGALDILDAGCGSGRLCQLLSSFGTVSGCDASAIALELARKRGQRVWQADLNHANLGEACYDVITLMDVLYHQEIRSEHDVLVSLWRALRPGGLLLVNLPAFEFLTSSHDKAIHTRRRYTRGTVIGMLADAGFRVERHTYRIFFLFPFAAAHRLASKLKCSKAKAGQLQSDVNLPHPLLNGLLTRLINLEARLIQTVSLPVGLSVFAIARKPET